MGRFCTKMMGVQLTTLFLGQKRRNKNGKCDFFFSFYEWMCTHDAQTAQWLIIHQSTFNINKIEIAHLNIVRLLICLYLEDMFAEFECTHRHTHFIWNVMKHVAEEMKKKFGICEAFDAYRIESIYSNNTIEMWWWRRKK